jgi:hypothetical protein
MSDIDHALLIEEYKSCRELILKNIDIMEKTEIYAAGAAAAIFVFSLQSSDHVVSEKFRRHETYSPKRNRQTASARGVNRYRVAGFIVGRKLTAVESRRIDQDISLRCLDAVGECS